jgi:hypothetical protein
LVVDETHFESYIMPGLEELQGSPTLQLNSLPTENTNFKNTNFDFNP